MHENKSKLGIMNNISHNKVATTKSAAPRKIQQ
jgi:hypothetical protein